MRRRDFATHSAANFGQVVGILDTERQLSDYTEQLHAAAEELQKLSSDAAHAANSPSTLAISKIKQDPTDVR